MAVPLMVIAGWLGTGAAGGAALMKLTDKSPSEIYEDVVRWALELAVKKAAAHGFDLDPEDPFSDASLSRAVSDRIGVPLRTIRDRRSVEDDLMAWAGRKLQERTGMEIRDFRDINSTRMDVIRFAGAKVAEHTGVPLTDITDRQQTMSDLKEWALSQAYEHMTADANQAFSMFKQSGVDVDTIVNSINDQIKDKDGAEPLSTKSVVMAMLHNGVVQQIARIGAKALVTSMKTRRQLQMQAASMRFRERHGSRMRYERLSDRRDGGRDGP